MPAYDIYGDELRVGDYAFVIKDGYGVYMVNIPAPRQIAGVFKKTVHGTPVYRVRFRGDPPTYARVPAHLMKNRMEECRKPKREPKGFGAFVTRIEK